MTLTFELDLESVKSEPGQISRSKVIQLKVIVPTYKYTQTQTHTHTEAIAQPGPQKRSANIIAYSHSQQVSLRFRRASYNRFAECHPLNLLLGARLGLTLWLSSRKPPTLRSVSERLPAGTGI